MLTTLKVKNGTYSDMQHVRTEPAPQGDCVVYTAQFALRDGYSEQRILTVQNGDVIAWQS
jgi:hypothetical protein